MVETMIEDIEFSAVVVIGEGCDVIPVVVMVIFEVVGIVAELVTMVGAFMLKGEVWTMEGGIIVLKLVEADA